MSENLPDSPIRANWRIVEEMNLLTAKPQIFLLNGEEKDVPPEIIWKIKELGTDYVAVNLAEAADLSILIKKAYEVLGLVSFFTTGEDETRAWTIAHGIKAPEAAGVIHTDFEEKFIRAEVIPYERLIEAGGWNQSKQKGWLQIEGKDYVVQDGDVMVIRHG